MTPRFHVLCVASLLLVAAPASAQQVVVRDHRSPKPPAAERPVIHRVAPVSGAPGTRVELIGRNFQQGDTITLSGKPLAISELTATRVVATIPDGATTDFLYLTRKGGVSARSPRRFRVLSPPPVITAISPELAGPGDTVRLSGTGFTARDRVSYGRSPARIRGRGPGWVDVQVPPRAKRSEHFTVRGPGGIARSPQPLQLDLPLVVTRFAPRRGAPRTQIEIYGRHFRDGDWVSLAGKRLPLVQVREDKITARVPPGAQSGPIAVGRRNSTVAARGLFEVLNPPSLTAFMPTRGEVGSRVTLTGRHLDGAKVYYGNRPVKVIEARGSTTLVVEVPKGAGDAPFRVVTRAGEATTAKAFQVVEYGVVIDAQPRRGVPGTVITLVGRHLDKVAQLQINGRKLAVTARSRTSISVRLPAGAGAGPIEYVSEGRRARTPFRVEVLAPPMIAAFSPTSGPRGTKIIIRGANFDRGARAYFGTTALRIAKLTPGEIIAVLPKSVGGSEYLYVEARGAKARSEHKFTVQVAPVIQSFSPGKAAPGARVTVRGRWFDHGTEILFGERRARVLQRGSDTIAVEVPGGLPAGPVRLVARNGTLQSTARQPFRVLASPKPPPPKPAPPPQPGKVKVRDHR